MGNENFKWIPQPEAENFIEEKLTVFFQKNSFMNDLRNELDKHTSTRFFDWIDHIVLTYTDLLQEDLLKYGFTLENETTHHKIFLHRGAQLPRIVLSFLESQGAALTVEKISDFLMVRGISREIEGSLYARFRRCKVSSENEVVLWVIERRGTTALEPIIEDKDYLHRYFTAAEKWETRSRSSQNEEDDLELALLIVKEIIALIGKDLAAWLILQSERNYWETKNRAGQVQKDRQDRLGMGWANHDHHTFRSSRKHFKTLVHLFELLGFHCRERFYAGDEAGWGAQVMENPTAKLVLFLDVDLDAQEISIDFAHHSLPELKKLGTIGLWCALHGDSILKSGMHHLEAQFLFENLKEDLSKNSIDMMKPFSNFDYLKQAFTAGEIWEVDAQRVSQLLDHGKISQDEARKFLDYGAIGSHLENLQRREGYKGFNQKNVSFIIKETDPRKDQ